MYLCGVLATPRILISCVDASVQTNQSKYSINVHLGAGRHSVRLKYCHLEAASMTVASTNCCLMMTDRTMEVSFIVSE